MLRKCLFIFTLLLSAAYPIAADPLAINLGGITFERQGAFTHAIFSFSGEGISVLAAGRTISSPHPCAICTPGTTANLSYDVFLGPMDFLSGNVTVGGVPYIITSDVPPSSPFVNATFNGLFLAGSATIPISDAATIILTAPFSFTGGMSLRNADGSVLGFGLGGSGFATLTLSRDQFGRYNEFNSLRYEFVPVPEPTTMLLLGTGIIGIAFRMRRRRRAL